VKRATDWAMVGIWTAIFVACVVELGFAGMGVWWVAHGAPSGGVRTRTVLIDCTESSPPLPHIGTVIRCEQTP
jgi:hypothetical protein